MKLLFFSMWYTPEPVGKPHSLARELTRLGHSVTVITGFPNYPQGEVYPYYRSAKLIILEHEDGVRIIRIRTLIDRSSNAFRRMGAMLSYSLAALFVGLLLGGRYDAVWSYQIGLPGMLYSMFTGKPHLHEIQDLWPAWGNGSLRGLNGILIRLLVASQRFIYVQARKLSTISSGFARVVSSIYGISLSKITILPNWAESDIFSRDSQIGHSRAEFGLPEGFVVTYGGNVGTAQGLIALVDAAACLKDISDLTVVIAGEGVEKLRLVEHAKDIGAHNVIFLPRLMPFSMGALLSISDLLYLGLSKGTKYEMTIPSKTYAYLSAGKPIIAAVAGDTAELVKKYHVGVAVPPEDVVAIASAIKEAVLGNRSVLKKMGDQAYHISKTEYSGPLIAKCYENVFLSLSQSI